MILIFTLLVISEFYQPFSSSYEIENEGKGWFPELGSLALGIGIGVAVAIPSSLLDKPINDLSGKVELPDLGEILSLPGDGYFIVPFTLTGYVSGVILKDDKLKTTFLRAGVSLAITSAVVQLIKFSGRVRPYASPSSQYNFSFPGLGTRNRSFPSGHSQASAALYITVGSSLCDSALCKIPFFALPFLVGAGRILAQDHWLSDIIGGLMIGSSFELF